MLFGYGLEQMVIGVVVSLASTLIKRKFKIDLRRELAVRLIFSLALAGVVALILSREYTWVATTASGALGLSYVVSNLATKQKNPTAETFLRSVAPELTDEQIKTALTDRETKDEICDGLTEILGKKMPSTEIDFIAGVIASLKKFGC